VKVKKWMVLVVTALIAVSALSGCGNGVKTKVETVTKSDHPVALTLDANVMALHMTNIVPKLSGKLISVPLTVGQDVKAGQIVVQVDQIPYQQNVAAAESALVTASMGTTPSRDMSEETDSSDRRAKLDVWYRMGAISKVEYNQMMSKENETVAGTAGSSAAPAIDRERIAQLQASIQAARDMLGNTTIYSPIDGRITAVSDNPSVAVAGMVLATVQQMTPLVATFAIPETYIQALNIAKQNGAISVTVLAPSGESQAGELTYLATGKDPATGSYMAKITFNNDKNLFVPGEFYHVRISTSQEVSQITIPKTAVRTKDSGDFVYIVNDSGLADVRSILTGDEEAGRVVVLDGLKDGERVVEDPPQSLEIGMKVTA
jgi:membrane fusion protein, multidrug efflux system